MPTIAMLTEFIKLTILSRDVYPKVLLLKFKKRVGHLFLLKNEDKSIGIVV